MAWHPSTALSDLILALSALNALWQLPQFVGITFARIGFLLIAMAATLGVIRFASAAPGADLVRFHQSASRAAATSGMAMLAAAMLDLNGLALVSRLFIGAAVGSQLGVRHLGKAAETTVAGAGILAIGGACFYAGEPNGTLAAATILLAGLGVGTEGNLLVVPRVDVFHYLLAATNWLLLQSFREQAVKRASA